MSQARMRLTDREDDEPVAALPAAPLGHPIVVRAWD